MVIEGAAGAAVVTDAAVGASTAGFVGAATTGAGVACASAWNCCCTCDDGVNGGAEAVSCTLPVVDAILRRAVSRREASEKVVMSRAWEWGGGRRMGRTDGIKWRVCTRGRLSLSCAIDTKA